MNSKLIRVLYSDNHLLVLDKPAELATMGTGETSTLHHAAVDYVRKQFGKPGRVFLGVVSRLDAMTSGVIVFARTSKAASRLTPQFAGEIRSETKSSKKKLNAPRAEKVYLAIVQGLVASDVGQLHDWVHKDEAARRMRTTDQPTPKSQGATLNYCVLDRMDDRSLLAIRLGTGRKHQIRVQFAERGHPVVGDRKYGSRQTIQSGIALHSWRLRLDHPTLRDPSGQVTRLTFIAPLPKSWRPLINADWWKRFHGDSQDWWKATADTLQPSHADSPP